jgi:hypothetical protein
MRQPASLLPHQILTRVVGGSVSVVLVRDPSDGSVRHGVRYTSGVLEWTSRHCFLQAEHAAAGADVLADFLGSHRR